MGNELVTGPKIQAMLTANDKKGKSDTTIGVVK